MSMSTYVVGYKPADEKWRNMKAIWDACGIAKVPVPSEVMKFFDGEDPGDKPGMEVDIKDALTPWHDTSREGFEVCVKALPPDVTVLRFVNSW